MVARPTVLSMLMVAKLVAVAAFLGYSVHLRADALDLLLPILFTALWLFLVWKHTRLGRFVLLGEALAMLGQTMFTAFLQQGAGFTPLSTLVVVLFTVVHVGAFVVLTRPSVEAYFR